MSYRVEILPAVRRHIAGWGLPEFLLVEVYLRLREELPQRPLELLRRTREPFDGIEYRFSVIDPRDRLCVHDCFFHVLYAQDEQTLIIAHFGYQRSVGA